MSEPLVTVLMAVRNGEAYLLETLHSILTQTFTNFEFLILDDGSTDTTPDILQHAAKTDPRIKILPGAGGLGASLAKGLPHARGEFIARMDADDIALPHRLATQAEFLLHNPHILLVSCWAEKFEGATGLIAPRLTPAQIKATLAFSNPIVHPGTMVRKSALTAQNLTYPAITTVEDYTLWTRLALHGPFAIIPEILIRYRIHATSMTATRKDIWYTLTESLQAEYIQTLTNLTPPPEHHAFARQKSLPLTQYPILILWLVHLMLHWPNPLAMLSILPRKILGYILHAH